MRSIFSEWNISPEEGLNFDLLKVEVVWNEQSLIIIAEYS